MRSYDDWKTQSDRDDDGRVSRIDTLHCIKCDAPVGSDPEEMGPIWCWKCRDRDDAQRAASARLGRAQLRNTQQGRSDEALSPGRPLKGRRKR